MLSSEGKGREEGHDEGKKEWHEEGNKEGQEEGRTYCRTRTAIVFVLTDFTVYVLYLLPYKALSITKLSVQLLLSLVVVHSSLWHYPSLSLRTVYLYLSISLCLSLSFCLSPSLSLFLFFFFHFLWIAVTRFSSFSFDFYWLAEHKERIEQQRDDHPGCLMSGFLLVNRYSAVQCCLPWLFLATCYRYHHRWYFKYHSTLSWFSGYLIDSFIHEYLFDRWDNWLIDSSYLLPISGFSPAFF